MGRFVSSFHSCEDAGTEMQCYKCGLASMICAINEWWTIDLLSFFATQRVRWLMTKFIWQSQNVKTIEENRTASPIIIRNNTIGCVLPCWMTAPSSSPSPTPTHGWKEIEGNLKTKNKAVNCASIRKNPHQCYRNHTAVLSKGKRVRMVAKVRIETDTCAQYIFFFPSVLLFF